MRRILPALAAVFTGGCGYIGAPLPPLANIPTPVADLAVVERASRIIVTFTVPQNTTEGTILRTPPKLDLRIGPSGSDWEQHATPLEVIESEKGFARTEVPVSEWTGREVTVGVRA